MCMLFDRLPELRDLVQHALHLLFLLLAIASSRSMHTLLDATFGDEALLELLEIGGDHLIR